MNNNYSGSKDRVLPEIPPIDRKMRLLIDTDAANEIDDLYAIALAHLSPERFELEGFVATHYAAKAGSDSTELSYDLLVKLLKAAGAEDKYIVRKGSHPMQYLNTPVNSEGVDSLGKRCAAGLV